MALTPHLRHCPRHKVLLPCNFCAQNPPKKVGAPLQGDHALSPAERQRRRRDRKRADRERPERAIIYAFIRKRIKSPEHGNIAAMRRALLGDGGVLAALKTMTIQDLRLLYDPNKKGKDKGAFAIHDHTGRSYKEGRTGGKDMDAVAAARWRDMGGNKYAARKPKLGPSPDVDFEPIGNYTPSELRGDSNPNLQIKPPRKEAERKLTIWDRIPELTAQMFYGDELDFATEYDPDPSGEPEPLPLHCSLCDFDTDTWIKARAHLEEMLKRFDKELMLIRAYQLAVSGDCSHYEGFENLLAATEKNLSLIHI